MSFIPLNLNDAVEAKPVQNGRYDVTIANVEEKLTKEKQTPQFMVQISIDDHEDAPNIFEYIQIPSPADDKKAMDFKALLLRRFLMLFGQKIDPAGFDPELLAMELVGARANCEVTQQEYQGNVSNKLVIPRLKGEESPGVGRGLPLPRRQREVNMMLAYQQRVVEEKQALDARLDGLNKFMHTESFRNLDKDERDRLTRQQNAMAEYSQVLGERIEGFKH